jgi:hypothetical protein
LVHRSAMPPKQTDPQFKLRLNKGLFEAIKDSAALNNRSINAEIIDRLEYSFGFLGSDGVYFPTYTTIDDNGGTEVHLDPRGGPITKTEALAIIAGMADNLKRTAENLLREAVPDNEV